MSSERLALPLRLRWSRRLPHSPKPAWPEPANQDYWHRKANLRPRVVYDRANGIVASQDFVVFGSSADDQVRAIDAQTGELRWRFFAEGPVRLAPAIWNDFVVFGADDGYVYGLALATGQLRWKTRPPEIGARRIPGNGRIISQWPIRGGVLVDKGTGYFTAGIFPQQGAFFFSIDVRNGQVLDRATLDKSVQGYLEQRDGRVFAPTGRDPQGVFLGAPPARSAAPTRGSQLDEQYYSRIADQAHIYCGSDEQVVATTGSGEEVWSATVAGRPYAMAIANGNLFVSTDKGWIYGFGPEPDEARVYAPSVGNPTPEGERRSIANTYLAQLPTRRGYALCVEPDDELLVALATQSALQIVVAVRAEDTAARLRQSLAELGLYGQVAVHVVAPLDALPYGDNLFNLVIGATREQVLRMVRPNGGIAFCDDGFVRREANPGAGNWTHAYGNAGNTASSQDTVAGKLNLQWFGGPGPRDMVDRHLRTMPPLANDGLLFVPGLDRVITVDAFNGTAIWEKSLPNSTRIGILKDCGWLAVDEHHLFVASGNKCVAHDVATGETAFELAVPAPNHAWGYLARVDNSVIGSTTLPGASRRTVDREAILEGAYTDNRPIVCSDGLFAFNHDTKNLRWQYKSQGAILNPTLAVNRTTVFFLENETVDFERNTAGRIELASFLSGESALVAIGLATGNRIWESDLPPIEAAQNAYVLCTADKVVLVNSRNEDTVHYDVRVFGAQTGKELWSTSQDNGNRVGGDHGEQDKHPVLVGRQLIVEPLAYDVDSGRRLPDLNLGKRGYGCGTLSASSKAVFFRSGNPAGYQLDTHQIELVTTVSRPGCWINMIPASGLLLIPEGSSGCTCNFPVQSSMAFAPEGPGDL